MKRLLLVFTMLFWAAKPSAQPLIDSTIKTSHAVMDNFMNQRFGLFIHWGPVTLRGTEIGWSRGRVVPIAEYDTLFKEFNPILFNADTWVKAAKDAGMKYVVITAKHHDGFCLWPTKVSDYNIMNSPFKKDIVGKLAEACKKNNLKFCVYFTVLDWHDQNYLATNTDLNGVKSTTNMEKFVATMKNELHEVITEYHPYMLWFDGNWEKQWKNEYAVDVYKFIKKLAPDIIINNRLGADGNHSKLTVESVGDFATPEQKVGEFNLSTPWETCMTICTQWAWKPNDKMKSLKECLQTLVKTAGGGGNLLFNVGPMPDGRIEQRQITRLKEIGDWLKINGESIYGTKGGPFAPNNDFITTRKDNRLYLHIFEKKLDTLTLLLPSNIRIMKSHLFNGESVKYSQDATGRTTIKLPNQLQDNYDTVIILELNTNAVNIPFISYP